MHLEIPDSLVSQDLAEHLDRLESQELQAQMVPLGSPEHLVILDNLVETVPLAHRAQEERRVTLEIEDHLVIQESLASPEPEEKLAHLELMVETESPELRDNLDYLDHPAPRVNVARGESKESEDHRERLALKAQLDRLAPMVTQEQVVLQVYQDLLELQETPVIPEQLASPVKQVPPVSQESVERGETLVMMDLPVYLEPLVSLVTPEIRDLRVQRERMARQDSRGQLEAEESLEHLEREDRLDLRELAEHQVTVVILVPQVPRVTVV